MARKRVAYMFCLCLAAVRLPAAESNLVLVAVSPSSGGVELSVEYPDSFTNRLDVLVSSNLLSSRWVIVAANLSVSGIHPFRWTDSTAPSSGLRAYIIGNAGYDSDDDGIPDARETLVYGTDPGCSDSDGDGVPDGAEVARETDPARGGDAAVVLYADSDSGMDAYDGLAPSVGGGHGPKGSMEAANRAAYDNDLIRVRGDSLFVEPLLCLGNKTVVIQPFGNVTVRP